MRRNFKYSLADTLLYFVKMTIELRLYSFNTQSDTSHDKKSVI